MQTSEPCRVIDPHTALDSVGPRRHLPGPGRLGPAPPVRGQAVSSLGAERRGRRPERGDAQSGHAQRGDEPARCGHARRLGERPLFGDPRPFGPASPAQVRLHPSAARPHGAVFFRRERPSRCQDLQGLFFDPFPNVFFKKKKKKKLPRSFGLWSFPSLMGFRRLPFSTDFIFLFPNHIGLPALSKLCQRREISSWLVSTPHVFSQQLPSIPQASRATRQRQGQHCSQHALGKVCRTRKQGARFPSEGRTAT